MATLPDTYARRTTPASRESFVAVPDGSQTGRALQRLGAQVGEIAERAQQQMDVAAVSAARRALDDWERSAIFDPEKGAITRRGENAFGVADELGKSFDDTAGKVAEGLSPRQQQAFQEIADSRRNQVLGWADKHVLRERESFEEGEYQADVKSFQERAALLPEKAPGELAMLQQRTIGYLRARGRSTQEIAAAVRENTDKAHVAVVDSLLSADQEDAAVKYFEANKAGMSPEVSARVGQEVRERGALIAAQRNADDLVKRGLPQAQAIEETRKKFQGRNETAAVQELKTRYAEAETARIQQVRDVSNSAWSVLMRDGRMSAIPAETMATLRSMAPEEERQMRDWLQAKAEQARARAKGEFQADDALYIGLRRMAWEKPDEFMRFVDAQGIEKSAPKLDPGQVSALLNVAGSINRQDARAMESNRVVGSVVNALDAQIRDAGLKRNAKPDSAQAAEYARFQTTLTSALDAANEQRTAKGQPPLSDKEARAIGEQMLREGIEQGSGFFGIGQTRRRGYEIASDPALAGKTFVTKTFDEIPQDVRSALTSELRAREPGAGPRGTLSDAQKQKIERAYQRGVEQGRFK